MPKARHAILTASYDPETLRLLGLILDEVWACLASEYDTDPPTVERARMQLASIILDLAKDRQLGALQIARTAARLMREAARNRV